MTGLNDVVALPVHAQPTGKLPSRIMRPGEYGLLNAIRNCETQLGTVEVYNRLCDAAAQLKQQIDAGKATPPDIRFLTDPDWIYPATMRGHG